MPERPRIREHDDGTVSVSYQGTVRRYRAPADRTGPVLELHPDGSTSPVHRRFLSTDPPLIVRPGTLLRAIRQEWRRRGYYDREHGHR